nr:DNA helicase [Tanacetum cinerariifolium]
YLVSRDERGLLELIDFIYDDTTLRAPTAGSLQEKALVCPKNATAYAVNAKILSDIEGESRTYLSNNQAIPMGRETSETDLLFSMEYLNTITFPGFLPHVLELKVGSPIMRQKGMIAKMRVTRRDKSFSWGKRRGRSMSVKDAGIISSALSSLQKFINDRSFLHQFKGSHPQKNDDSSSTNGGDRRDYKFKEPLSRTDGGRFHFVVQCITFPCENLVLALEIKTTKSVLMYLLVTTLTSHFLHTMTKTDPRHPHPARQGKNEFCYPRPGLAYAYFQ